MMLWDLVWNSFMAHLPWPPRPESVYYAMLAFGRDATFAFIGGLLGNALASALLVGLGMQLARANRQRDEPSFLKVQKYLNRYAVWFLAIPGVGLQPVLMLMFAIVGVSPRRLALVLAIEHGSRYAITAFITHQPETTGALIRYILL